MIRVTSAPTTAIAVAAVRGLFQLFEIITQKFYCFPGADPSPIPFPPPIFAALFFRLHPSLITWLSFWLLSSVFAVSTVPD